MFIAYNCINPKTENGPNYVETSYGANPVLSVTHMNPTGNIRYNGPPMWYLAI